MLQPSIKLENKLRKTGYVQKLQEIPVINELDVAADLKFQAADDASHSEEYTIVERYFIYYVNEFLIIYRDK